MLKIYFLMLKMLKISNAKNLVLMALNMYNCEPVALKWLFQRITKNHPAARGFAPRSPCFAPRSPLSPAAGGTAPNPSVIRLNYTSLLDSSLNLHFLALVFTPLAIAKLWLGAKQRPRLLIFQSTIFLSHKKFVPLSKISDDVFTCDLWFAPPPPIKNPGYAYAQYPLFV